MTKFDLASIAGPRSAASPSRSSTRWSWTSSSPSTSTSASTPPTTPPAPPTSAPSPQQNRSQRTRTGLRRPRRHRCSRHRSSGSWKRRRAARQPRPWLKARRRAAPRRSVRLIPHIMAQIRRRLGWGRNRGRARARARIPQQRTRETPRAASAGAMPPTLLRRRWAPGPSMRLRPAATESEYSPDCGPAVRVCRHEVGRSPGPLPAAGTQNCSLNVPGAGPTALFMPSSAALCPLQCSPSLSPPLLLSLLSRPEPRELSGEGSAANTRCSPCHERGGGVQGA